MEEEAKLIGGAAFWLLAAFIAFVVITTLFGGWSMIFGREAGKYKEETRRQIVEESRAYQEGMAQNLDRLCLEWDATGSAAIAQSIRHRSAGFKGELPEHIQQCVDAARKVN